jgi:1-acyl-sn-glycerol-3-phosphate acyltransferase
VAASALDSPKDGAALRALNQPMQAQPPLEFIPPQLIPWLPACFRPLLPLLLRSQANIVAVEGRNLESLARLYEQFQQGDIRLMLAFRHPQASDPLCLAYLFWSLLPQAAQQSGLPLKRPVHAHFLYDRGIPLWAGRGMGWIYSRLGGSSIQRGKLDLKGLRSARDLLVKGDYPLAAAPEGATNGHSEIISPLEPGVAQMAFWAVEDLHKAQRDLPVQLLPLGIQYRYVGSIWSAATRLLRELEQSCGLTAPASMAEGPLDDTQAIALLYPRLLHLGDWLLLRLEAFYRDCYHQPVASPDPITETNRGDRLHQLLDTALQVAESFFGLPAKGSVIDRCRRVEQAGWEWIYRSDFKEPAKLSAVDRGLADRVAAEADRRMWHMRLVESFVAVSGSYVREKPTAERFGETLLLLWDLVNRIAGNGKPLDRPKLGPQRAIITVGEPIDVSKRQWAHRSKRQEAVGMLTQDLYEALQGLIERDSP